MTSADLTSVAAAMPAGALSDAPNYLPAPDRCTGEPLIQMEEIVKIFKSAAGEFAALKGVTACFYPGEFVSVVGKSGSGKSTLVNMITGIDHPTSGTVRVADTYVHNLSENDMSLWRGKNLGIVFQFFQLMPTLTLLENVMLPMYLANLYTPAGREQRARELLAQVGLAEMVDKLPAAVSGGQQQTAAIARALANDPPILIADEPTGNLDSRTADEIFDLFCGLIEGGKSILMVTHDINLAARTTRTMLISDGELVNSYVALALHGLEHIQLLWLTHHLTPQFYAPGAPVGRDRSDGGLYLVASGELALEWPAAARNPDRRVVLATGDFISLPHLAEAGAVLPRLSAAGAESLELLALPQDEYATWLQESPAAGAGLARLSRRALDRWLGRKERGG